METIGRDLREMQRVPLTAEHVAALRAEGSEAIYPAGTYIVRPGDPVDRFIYVEDGEIEVVNPFGEERHVPSTIGPTQFMGEISFLGGGSWSIPMRAARDTRVLEVPRPAMLRLMAAIPEMSDIIITVLAARRRSARTRIGRCAASPNSPAATACPTHPMPWAATTPGGSLPVAGRRRTSLP